MVNTFMRLEGFMMSTDQVKAFELFGFKGDRVRLIKGDFHDKPERKLYSNARDEGLWLDDHMVRPETNEEALEAVLEGVW